MFYFLDKDFWVSPALIFLFSATIFLIVLLRYLLLAGAYHFLIQRIFKLKKTQPAVENRKQFLREIKWSAISSSIFTLLGVSMYWLYQQGFTRIYSDIHKHSLWYFVLSIIIVMILYETYYYWLHRWMHQPHIFKIVHRVHHESIHTSVFTSFAFHPFEAILQFAFLPVIVMIMPLHYYALGIVLLLMTISAIINHAGAEIFPANFHKHPIGKWLIGSTHHDLHHTEFRTNFGLYFTFWDKWMKTESKVYREKFEVRSSKFEV